MTDYAYRITNPHTGDTVVAGVRVRGDIVRLKRNTGEVIQWTRDRWRKAQQDLEVECIGVLRPPDAEQ